MIHLAIPRRRLTLLAVSAGIGIGLAACNSMPEPEYSPRYHYTSVASSNGRTATGLMPDACIVGPWQAEMDMDMLPAGCANAYNLQQMVERESDLVQGRSMGPAPAAPAYRAAKKYLSGESRQPMAPQANLPVSAQTPPPAIGQ